MQVKKFEAKSMKEALQLVKQELGPEAIILSAKDNKRSFGLAGKGSVEITAAISEKSLQKKKYVEKNLPENAREKFRGQTARRQKEFIDESIAKLQGRNNISNEAANARIAMLSNGVGAMSRRPMTSQRYIDIDSDELPQTEAPAPTQAPLKGRRVDDLLREFSSSSDFIVEEPSRKNQTPAQYQGAAQGVIQGAWIQENPARRAHNQNGPSPMTSQEQTYSMASQGAMAQEEVFSLRKEVETLREMLKELGREKTVTRHPGADYGLPFELSANFEKLTQSGVDTRYIVEILNIANEQLNPMEKKKASLVDGWVARYILSHTSVTAGWIKAAGKCSAHLFVGPSGHGKTSALVKTASQLALNEKKRVAIVSADTFKVGAVDQLRIYCQILNLPFETLKHGSEFPRLMQKFSTQGYDAVLVDYPGFSLKDIQEIDQIRTLMPAREISKQIHLVISCAIKDQDAYEICHRYQVTHFDDLMVTKIDESFAHGFLYNIQRKTEKPLYAFGLGAKIPEDIELATRERVIDLIYKITKNNK